MLLQSFRVFAHEYRQRRCPRDLGEELLTFGDPAPVAQYKLRADGMYGQGGMGGGGMGGGGGGMGGGGRRMDEVTEGKLFLGGLDQNVTNEQLVEYCSGWCAPHSHKQAAARQEASI